MRTTTGPEDAVLAGAYGYQVQHRLKVANGSGTMKDWSSWVESVDTDRSIDNQVDQLDITFRRDFGTTLSLSPLRTDSTLNVLDDNVTFAPAIDGGRAVTWEIATTPKGTAPVAGDWKVLFTGVIDTVDFDASPMQVVARDLGGRLVDRWVETEVVEPAIGSLEAGIQRLLDAGFGAGVIPLNTPVSPGYALNAYKQQVQPISGAVQALQQLIGWDTRYMWDNASSTFKFTLWDVGRAKVIPDYTFAPSRILSINKLRIDKQSVRNVIIVSYKDVTTGTRSTITVSDATSITKYDRQVLLIVEADDSPINSAALATTMANLALSDLKDPKAEQTVEMFLWWPSELNDLYRFSANARQYNSNQDWAVVGIKHHFSLGKHRTTLTVRGKPSGGYNSWINRGDPHGDPGTPNPKLFAYISQGGRDDVYNQDLILSVDGGDAPLTWRTRLVNSRTGSGAWSAWHANSGGFTLPYNYAMFRTPRWSATLEFQYQDGAGRFSNIAQYQIDPYDPSYGSLGYGMTNEDGSRGGRGGLDLSGQGYFTQPPYTSDGFNPMWDPNTGRIQDIVTSPYDGSSLAGRRLAKRVAGTGYGAANEDRVRGGSGGTDLSGLGYNTQPPYTADGFTPMWNPNNGRFTGGGVIFMPTGTTFDDTETGGIRGKGGFTNSTGGLASTAADNNSRPVNRTLVKTLVGDPDTLDGTPEGTTYKRVSNTAVDGSSNIDLSKVGVVNRYLVNLARSAGNATTLATIAGQLADTGHASSTMQESGARALNRLLAKTLVGDADSLDGTPEGTTYKRVSNLAVDAGTSKIDFTKTGFLGKNADNVGRSAGDATGVSTIIARLANTGQPDGTMQATDGSVLAGGRTAKRAAGTGSGASEEDRMRGGGGGVALLGQRYITDAPYTSDGFTPMWNPATGRMTGAVMMPAGTAMDDTESRVVTALENSGNINVGIQQRNGTGLKNLASGRYSLGTGVHTQSITYPTNYQNPPAINILGGISYQPASLWGTAANADANPQTGVAAPNANAQVDEVVAYNVTTATASLRARLRQASASTARSNAYAAGAITTNGGTLEATTASAPAANDTYTTDFQIQFTSTAVPGKACSVSGTVCLDWWNGSVWTQVASVTYTASDPVGGNADTGLFTDALVATVSGLTTTSKFRLRLVTNAGNGARTYSVDPGNVTYTTTTGDQYTSKTPASLGINLSVEVIGAS